MIFLSRSHNQLLAVYLFDGQVIQVVKTLKDLGVIIDGIVNFSEHINSITLCTYRSLGFIWRASKEFKNVN